MHRIGFHFPSVVVDQVCAHYGIVLSAAGTLIKDEDIKSFRNHRQNKAKGQEQKKDQITINTEARDAIRDLFPNIPDNDLHQIIKTAFQKGQRKVGTATELPLVRRAQLSVVAHVRHMYTKYDKLLRQVHYTEARSMVEAPTLRKLVEWRGDDENGKAVLEDVFREVIVISDDEESDEESDSDPRFNRRTSVEPVSRHTDNPIIELLPINYAARKAENGNDSHEYSEDEPTQGYQYIHRAPRRRILPEQPNNQRLNSRYDAWDRAREQYRADPNPFLSDDVHRQPYRPEEVFPQHPEPPSDFPKSRQSKNMGRPRTPPGLIRINEPEVRPKNPITAF